MTDNEFLLPTELGWKANDELADYIDEWVRVLRQEILLFEHSDPKLWSIAKAELMDNMYAIIKKYQ
jgi:hypothetical protein